MKARALKAEARQKCGIGSRGLDQFLRGGLPTGLLVEISGEATASKTQLCLQLMLNAQRPLHEGGLGGATLYIYSEGEPPWKRFRELAQLQRAKYVGTANPTDNIFVEKDVRCGKDLLFCLRRAEGLLQRQTEPPIKLIVIDSIAYLFRDLGEEFDAISGRGEYANRSTLLFTVAALLKQYADEFQLLVVVSNQVTDVVADTTNGPREAPQGPKQGCLTGGMQLFTSGRQVVPALGLAWASCINMRIFLSKCPEIPTSAIRIESTDAQCGKRQWASVHSGCIVRCMQVVFSPYVPPSHCFYVVLQDGLQAVTLLDKH